MPRCGTSAQGANPAAPLEALLPIAAVAIGMSVFAVVLHLSV